MYLLTGNSNKKKISSAALQSGKPVSEFEWSECVEFIGGVCNGGIESFEHSSCPMLRHGPLRGKLKTSPTDLMFCRNGMFEVLVAQSLASKLSHEFPSLRFEKAVVECSRLRNAPEYFELVRPICYSIDYERSGFEVGRTCSFCGFVETTRASKCGLHLGYSRVQAAVGTTWQNPFLCIVSKDLGNFLLNNSTSAFSLLALEDW